MLYLEIALSKFPDSDFFPLSQVAVRVCVSQQLSLPIVMSSHFFFSLPPIIDDVELYFCKIFDSISVNKSIHVFSIQVFPLFLLVKAHETFVQVLRSQRKTRHHKVLNRAKEPKEQAVIKEYAHFVLCPKCTGASKNFQESARDEQKKNARVKQSPVLLSITLVSPSFVVD